jgi:regulator of RNase E activity RraA
VIRMKILGLEGIVVRGRIRNLKELQVLSLLVCYRFL